MAAVVGRNTGGRIIRAEFRMRLATTYKTFTKISVSWLFGVRTTHTHSCTVPASPVRRLLVVIEILPVLAGGWWRRHQHPPKEPANSGDENDLAFFISFLPIVDICFFRSRSRSRAEQSHPSRVVGGAGGVAGYCWRKPDENCHPLGEDTTDCCS